MLRMDIDCTKYHVRKHLLKQDFKRPTVRRKLERTKLAAACSLEELMYVYLARSSAFRAAFDFHFASGTSSESLKIMAVTRQELNADEIFC